VRQLRQRRDLPEEDEDVYRPGHVGDRDDRGEAPERLALDAARLAADAREEEPGEAPAQGLEPRLAACPYEGCRRRSAHRLPEERDTDPITAGGCCPSQIAQIRERAVERGAIGGVA